MSFLRAIASAIRNYFNFSGRANRREFWYWILFALAMWLLLLQIDLLYWLPIDDLLAERTGYMPMEEGAPQPLNLAWLAFCVIPTLSLIVRRVHDHDQPAWKALLVVPLAWWLFAKGTKGPNRFG